MPGELAQHLLAQARVLSTQRGQLAPHILRAGILRMRRSAVGLLHGFLPSQRGNGSRAAGMHVQARRGHLRKLRLPLGLPFPVLHQAQRGLPVLHGLFWRTCACAS